MIKPLRLSLFAFAMIIAFFLSGVLNAETGVTENEILIGSSLALKGHAGYLGSQTMIGAMAYIQYINETEGGVNGRKIRVISYDDGYDPDTCVANTRKLIEEDQVFALFCYVGTPTSVKIIPIVEEAEIPLIGLFTGAEALREPVKRSIYNIRASYYEETAGIVSHFWEDLGLRKIAVFYQNDAFGQAGLRGVELALQKYNAKITVDGTYERGAENISPALSAIREKNPDAVIMLGVYGACARFIQSAKWSGFNPYFHTVSFVGANQMAYYLGAGRDSDGVIVTQVVPPPESDYPGVVEYRNLLQRYYPLEKPNFVSLEGFINAKVLVGILKETGEDPTRERFFERAESLKDYDVGLESRISYGPQDHRGMKDIYYTVIRDGKYHLIEDWNALK